MRLNHLNLTVTNAEETAAFLVKYFGFRPLEGAKNSAAFAIILDESQFVLTLMRGKRGSEIVYPEHFHIGFAQPSEEKVNEIHQRLAEDGFDVPAPARLHGSWTLYFRAPGGILVEVLA